MLEDALESIGNKDLFLGRTTGAVEEDVGQCACPELRADLRQELVGNGGIDLVLSLKHGVDAIGKKLLVMAIGGHEGPVGFG